MPDLPPRRSARPTPPTRPGLAASISISAVLLAGCASGPTWLAGPAAEVPDESALTRARLAPPTDPRSAPRADRDPLFPASDPVARARAENIVFADGGAEARDEATDEASAPGLGDERRDWLVNAYGELVNRTVPTRGPFDGAGNLVRITSATEGASFHPAVDRGGEVLVFASTQHRVTSDLYAKSVNGRTHRQLTSDPADDVMPAIAPDGTEVAFASNRFGSWDIFVMPLAGGRPVRITDGQDDAMHPSFSPDGRWLAYGLFPEWNPDPGRSRIAYQRARERGSRLFSVWTLDVVAGEATNRTEIVSAANAACMHPTWSPDGRRLSFVTVLDPDEWGDARPPRSDVWVIGWDGKGKTILTDSDSLNLDPAWSSTGAIYFMSDRSGTDNIWAVETGRTIVAPGRSAEAEDEPPAFDDSRVTNVFDEPGRMSGDGP